ncbi:MAG: DUF3060 domain-containing protein [Flavobacteriaceae bacterium]|nr:DUF3060 domain-containing protein [Flavobacteriaceae bacterium]
MKKLILSVVFASIGIIGLAQDGTTIKSATDSQVTAVAKESQPAEIVISGNDKEESISLNGETLIVKGDNIVVHAAGEAEKVVVEGNNCQIVIDETKFIEIKGEKSYVYFRKGDPKSDVSDGSAIQKIEG